jgi:Holliday junction DNA helicase RuvB
MRTYGFIQSILDYFYPPVRLKDFKSKFFEKVQESFVEQDIKPIKTVKSNIFRPKLFKDYIGQTNAKETIKSYIEGTKQRNKLFPHFLINGNAGCGKTTLVRIIANELRVGITELVGKGIFDLEQLVEHFLNANGGIVFIDEIHALPREFVEPLYSIMEDFTYEGQAIEPFVFAGATTEIGEIIKDRRPFYDRFKIKIELDDYTIWDIRKIIKNYQVNLFPQDKLEVNDYTRIARNSRMTPRRGINLLESTIYLNGDVSKALRNNKIIANGFTYKDLQALKYIASSTSGVGLESVALYLDTSKENYTYDIEPYLLKNGLISRTSKGRKITELGINLIKILDKKRV